MILVLALIFATVANGQNADWTAMSGAEIRKALAGRVLHYDGAWQDFRTSGKTLYNAGRDSWGNWRIEADQYCSQWPPSDLWACYTMDNRQGTLRFVGEGGDITEATYGE